jgi:hypothetical protein
MQHKKFLNAIFLTYIFIPCYWSIVSGQTESNYVKGNLITFDSNGFWCWFQDERAIVDTAKKKLICGAVQSGGTIHATVYDLELKTGVTKNIGTESYDDHAAPGFCILPGGKYLAMFCDHYDKYNTHYSLYDGAAWSTAKNFDYSKIPGGTNYTIAYNNIYYLSSEGRIYDCSRANNRSPNFIYSMDTGKTWVFGGQLTTDPSDSYNKGYYKYWSNHVDRIDFCCTEQHPRDFETSIYHGYIKGGKSYSTNGVCADSNIFDTKNLPTSKNFTKVFANGVKVDGVSMVRCWQSDIMRYPDGVIAIIFQARANNSISDHRFFYARYDGKEWKWTYLGKGGGPLYSDEQDYIGLGALCPNDQNTIYLSTPLDPSNGSSVGKHEIFKGVTKDFGATWQWEAITKNSSMDNLRPIVPEWDNKHYALLWCRGSYTAAQNFSTKVVGIIDTQTSASIIPVNTKISGNPLPVFSMNTTSPDAFGNSITIRYSLPENSFVTMRVYSALGREAAVLVDNKKPAGNHTVNWMPQNAPVGMYFCKIDANGMSKTISFMVLNNF